MARPLRIEYPGAMYHITSRGNEKKPIYRDDQDREDFLFILDKVSKRYHWQWVRWDWKRSCLHFASQDRSGATIFRVPLSNPSPRFAGLCFFDFWRRI